MSYVLVLVFALHGGELQISELRFGQSTDCERTRAEIIAEAKRIDAHLDRAECVLKKTAGPTSHVKVTT
jgi:hypothetical protein